MRSAESKRYIYIYIYFNYRLNDLTASVFSYLVHVTSLETTSAASPPLHLHLLHASRSDKTPFGPAKTSSSPFPRLDSQYTGFGPFWKESCANPTEKSKPSGPPGV